MTPEEEEDEYIVGDNPWNVEKPRSIPPELNRRLRARWIVAKLELSWLTPTKCPRDEQWGHVCKDRRHVSMRVEDERMTEGEDRPCHRPIGDQEKHLEQEGIRRKDPQIQ